MLLISFFSKQKYFFYTIQKSTNSIIQFGIFRYYYIKI